MSCANQPRPAAHSKMGEGQTDKTSYLVSLDLKNSLFKTAMCAGSVCLEIHPNGNDTWEFTYNMWMFFSDKTATEKHWDGKVLTGGCPSSTDAWREMVVQ